MRFKRGIATMRSRGLIPYDAMVIRKLPSGHWQIVEIFNQEDLNTYREKIAPVVVERIHYYDAQKIYLRKLQTGTKPIGATQFWREINDH